MKSCGLSPGWSLVKTRQRFHESRPSAAHNAGGAARCCLRSEGWHFQIPKLASVWLMLLTTRTSAGCDCSKPSTDDDKPWSESSLSLGF